MDDTISVTKIWHSYGLTSLSSNRHSSNCYPLLGHGEKATFSTVYIGSMLPRPVNILFVSRRNTLRSVIAEACLAKLGGGRIRAFSCGAPKQIGQHPEPAAIDALRKAGFPATVMACRDWTSFTRHAAPRMNYVITLAQEIAGDTPTWPGQPVTAIWPFDDALETGETPEALERATWITLLSLRRRSELLVSLPMQSATRAALRDDIRDMSQMP